MGKHGRSIRFIWTVSARLSEVQTTEGGQYEKWMTKKVKSLWTGWTFWLKVDGPLNIFEWYTSHTFCDGHLSTKQDEHNPRDKDFQKWIIFPNLFLWHSFEYNRPWLDWHLIFLYTFFHLLYHTIPYKLSLFSGKLIVVHILCPKFSSFHHRNHPLKFIFKGTILSYYAGQKVIIPGHYLLGRCVSHEYWLYREQTAVSRTAFKTVVLKIVWSICSISSIRTGQILWTTVSQSASRV